MKTYKNVLLIMSDQHKQSVTGCFGNELARTPHIDMLAETGVRFDNAFTTCPLCGPARMAMLTGSYPHVNGNVSHPNRRYRTGEIYDAPLKHGAVSLTEGFREHGYRTYCSGYLGVHASRDGRELTESDMGFDVVEANKADYESEVGREAARQYHLNGIHSEMWEPHYQNTQGNVWRYDESLMWDRCAASHAVRFLREAARAPGQPFFAHVGFRAPHTPWVPPARFRELYDAARLPLPDYRVEHRDKPRRLMERFTYFDCRHYPEEIVRDCIASYYAFVSFMDDCVGEVVAELDRLGLREETLVIFASDHGEMLFEHGICEKQSMFESSVRIPLVFSLPGSGLEGTAAKALVENIDILPTALALCGLPLPAGAAAVNGRDLTPCLQGGKVREHVFSEFYHSLDPTRMVRDDRYKFVFTLDDINELYDLENDPQEMTNLCQYPAYAERAARMEAEVLRDWEIPQLPLHATWNDLNERKQNQLLKGLDIPDFRPPPPPWVKH